MRLLPAPSADGSAVNDMDHIDDLLKLIPSFEPGEETPVSDNTAFLEACMSKAAEDAASSGYELGNYLVTHTQAWGFVFRIDFRTAFDDQNTETVNRLVYCSAETNEPVGSAIIFGQKFKPL
jgi:hypothetical protein